MLVLKADNSWGQAVKWDEKNEQAIRDFICVGGGRTFQARSGGESAIVRTLTDGISDIGFEVPVGEWIVKEFEKSDEPSSIVYACPWSKLREKFSVESGYIEDVLYPDALNRLKLVPSKDLAVELVCEVNKDRFLMLAGNVVHEGFEVVSSGIWNNIYWAIFKCSTGGAGVSLIEAKKLWEMEVRGLDSVISDASLKDMKVSLIDMGIDVTYGTECNRMWDVTFTDSPAKQVVKDIYGDAFRCGLRGEDFFEIEVEKPALWFDRDGIKSIIEDLQSLIEYHG